jgi:bifunctional non-homologous end joining protein LigD
VTARLTEAIVTVYRTAMNAQVASRNSVALTHPDRVYWPDSGVTKQDLADYYAAVWPLIAPFVTGRPLALLRAPTGIGGAVFFQKHAWKGVNPAVRQVIDPKDRENDPYLAIDSLEGLIALAQSAVLEIHPWGSTLDDWERPEMLILDLDPGEGTTWGAVVEAARDVRMRLEDHGLAAFLKTSGGKGLHVVSPLRPEARWPAAKAFAKAVADSMAADDPYRYVSTIVKEKRREKVLIDYLRNQRGQTAVAPYSPRARAGAPVSMPISWQALETLEGPHAFTLRNAAEHLAARSSDPWSNFLSRAKPLPKPGRK